MSMPAQNRDHHQSAFWLLIILTSSVFLIEILLMVVLPMLPAMSDTASTLLDAFLLSILLFPIFYFLVFRPLILSITQRKKAEGDARNALEELRHQKFALDQHSIVGVTDVRGTILYANDQFCAISGYAREELLGQDHRILNSGTHPKEYFRNMYHTIAAGNVWHGELCNRAKDGHLYWVDTTIVPYMDDLGKPIQYISMRTDITERKRVESNLKKSEELWKFALEGSGDGVWDWNFQTGDAKFSKRWKEMLGFTESEIENNASEWKSRVHPDDLPLVFEALQAHMDGKTSTAIIEFRMLCKDGSWKWIQGRGIVVSRSSDGKPLRLVGTNTDITERKQMEEHVRHLAFYDELTNLPNRRLLNDRLTQAMAASKRTENYGAVIFLDLDNFKPLNDMHGHVAGDLLLIEAASRLKSCVREIDTVARFGGDEFVVMLSELDVNKEEATLQAQLVAEKIQVALSAPCLLAVSRDGEPSQTVEHHCTASIGVAMFINHEGSRDDILKWADTAMYQAKNAGRNSIRFYES